MNEREQGNLAADDPAALRERFRRAGVQVQEQNLASAAGPRWGVLVRAPGADLWVEASDRIEAWWKAAAYAAETGILTIEDIRFGDGTIPK